MRPQANFTRQLAIIAVFAASCVLILVYLWGAFGGNIPLKPKNYQLKADFPDASNLALNADVRISGVNVGHVIAKSSAAHNTTRVTFDLESAYAPLPIDARAMLRQKTAFGEIYVDVTPGDRTKPKLPEGGSIAKALISPSVELDEIFRTFDQPTRDGLRRWFQEQAVGLQGRGRDLSDALGNLPGFAESTDRLLKTAIAQDGAVRQLVSNTGTVFDALSERRGQLRGAITNWNTVFATLASRNTQLEGTFKALPTFAKEGAAAMRRLAAFAKKTDPLVTQLRPAARALAPTLQQLDGLAPDFNAVMRDFNPLVDAAKKGLPAGTQFFDETRQLIAAFPPVLTQLNPLLGYLGVHKDDLMAFIVNATAATQASSVPRGEDHAVHYLRALVGLGPASLSHYDQRQGWSRANPYALTELSSKSGLKVYDSRRCSDSGWPTLVKTPVDGIDMDFLNRIDEFALNNGVRSTPSCVQEQRGTPTFPQFLPTDQTTPHGGKR
ncbi:MAG: phospholipid/cholesterol/gamma-HCH transport system substrate-binding protein [Solirubrobacteraceae bacterium]|nr:phospholipid/cholesterol/gamma-HCH transport system substrate-binding protein [Solirubrobacteraceae bacterium]